MLTKALTNNWIKIQSILSKISRLLLSPESKEFRDLILENLNLSIHALENICNSYDKNANPKSLKFFFQSIFHMAINRLFISEQRLFEMIIYDYLHRYYKTQLYHKSTI